MGFSTNRPVDYFAMGIQSAKDTEATTFKFFRQLDGTGLEFDEDIGSEREGGDGQEEGLRYKKLIKADGAVHANVRGEITALLSAGALGKTATVLTNFGATTTSGATDVAPTACVVQRYVPNPTLPYFTTEQRYADQIERESNMKVTTLEFSGEAGLPLKLTGQLVGAGTIYQRDIASALTATRESGDPVYFPRGSYVIDGAGSTKVSKFKLSAKRGVDDNIQTTDLWREDVIELNADYDLDVTVQYIDRTLYQKAHYSGGSQVPVPLPTGSFSAYSNNGLAPAATAYRSLKLALAQLQYVGAKVNKLDPDGKTMYLDIAYQTLKGATDSLVVDVITASQPAFV